MHAPRSVSKRPTRGAVTAEAAGVIPVMLVVAISCVWLFAFALAKVQVTDAAREVAREAARGDSSESAVARGRDVAPGGARIDLREDGAQIVADVAARVQPFGIFDFLPAPTVTATATASKEDL